MLDSHIRPLIDPPLKMIAKIFVQKGITPDQITWGGFGIGMLGALCLTFHFYTLALILILMNRLADGLDGAVARETKTMTDRGGYLDIVLDFIFYSGVIFFFALGHSDISIYAAFLIYSFIGTGSSFLTYAIIAGKRGLSTEARGKKSFFHSGGLAEGTETILTMILICLFPAYFSWIAVVFGVMCWITTAGRIKLALEMFEESKETA